MDYEEGLAEWIDGEAFLYMSAKYPHQRIVSFLTTFLNAALGASGKATVLGGPYAMSSGAGKPGREPDIMVVSAAHHGRLKAAFLDGNPDLVIEVVSDDSDERDYVTKFREYATNGIAEYWIVDSREGHEGARFFALDSGAYVERQTEADGMYRSTAFPTLRLRPAWFFEDPPPLATALELARSAAANE